MALRAGLVAVMLSVVVAIAAPWAAAADHERCVTSTECVTSSSNGSAGTCLTDERCAGVHVAASGFAIAAIVVAAGLLLPSLLRRRSDVALVTVPPPLLMTWQLLRPPQALLPS